MHRLHVKSALAAIGCATLVAGAAAAPAAAAPKLKLGFYDCMAYDYSSGMLTYQGSVKLAGKRRYEHSFGRKGRKMVDKTTGRFRIKGTKITFKGGAMGKTPGRIKPSTIDGGKPFFNVLVEGRASGVSCYYTKV